MGQDVLVFLSVTICLSRRKIMIMLLCMSLCVCACMCLYVWVFIRLSLSVTLCFDVPGGAGREQCRLNSDKVLAPASRITQRSPGIT